jgi:carbon-monoxide dehydrogenase iron sulfur subunit
MNQLEAVEMSAICIIPERCTGCQSCEMVCSLSHEGSCSPSLSRIHMKKWEEISVFMPIVCQHCEKPPCISACPTRARKRNAETGAVFTEQEQCVGCKSCLYACPYGAPVLHPVTKRTVTCDLCDGVPLCTQVCTAGALSYTPEGDSSMERKRALGKIYLQSIGTK